MKKCFLGTGFYLACLLSAHTQLSAAPILLDSEGINFAPFNQQAASENLTLEIDDFNQLTTLDYEEHGNQLDRTDYTITSRVRLRSTTVFNVIEGAVSMIQYNNSDPLTFIFDSPINAFAVAFRDLDMGPSSEFRVSIDGGPKMVLTNVPAQINSDYTYGIIDTETAFTTISFDRSEADGYGFDLVTYGAVPEPGSLVAYGLAAMMGLQRKRHASGT